MLSWKVTNALSKVFKIKIPIALLEKIYNNNTTNQSLMLAFMQRCIVIVCIFLSVFATADNVQESVLKQGNFYKIGVSQSGLHKIDYNFLVKLGLNPQNIDPNKIKIYGNGIGMLPQSRASFRWDDLKENSTKFYGLSNGKFNSTDFILFYAQGSNELKINGSEINHIKNIYSDKSYYFIHISDSNNIKIKENTNQQSTTATSVVIDYYDDLLYINNDLQNMLMSGRTWYGEDFGSTTTRNFNFDFTGLMPNSNISIRSAYFNKSRDASPSTFKLYLNENLLKSDLVFGTRAQFDVGSFGMASLNLNAKAINNNSSMVYKMTFEKSEPAAVGYLDYVEIQAKRSLNMIGNSLIFRTLDAKSNISNVYNIGNASNGLEVWNISTTPSPIQMSTTIIGNTLQFQSLSMSQIEHFVAFYPNQITQIPSFESKIPNQNIHGAETPQLLIITHPSFENEAKRLAQFKNSIGIKTLVATTDQVYNEFSSGAQDITAIRDCAAMFYARGGLKNLILFGACSYDYKNRIADNTNFVPVYQARESTSGINSYCSDDYYGFFGDNEGEWAESNSNYNMLIGVGRLPVRNAEEASIAVDKIINYKSNKNAFGKWKNKILLLADNADANGHIHDAEELSTVIETNTNAINITKAYIDAYPLKLTPIGTLAPKINSILRNNIDKGVLIINYSGHGGPENIAQEQILNGTDAQSFTNFDKLNFYITATCDFGLCDQPKRTGGALELLLAKKGGAIGTITATRPVYKSTNLLLNKEIYKNMFIKDAKGNRPDIGEVFRNAKNASAVSVFNRSYMLFGDPSSVLAFPEHNVVLTSINGLSVAADTLEALSKVTIQGEIRDKEKNMLMQNFNGTIEIDLFDKYSELRTLAQYPDQESPFDFKMRDNAVLSAKASVENGKFVYSFILPKDINYKVGDSKFSLYAFDKKQLIDAGGYTNNVMLGGTNVNAPEDNTPPEIHLYMDDTTFRNKGMTGSKPLLLIKLADESGINIARSGIGHEITGVLDNNIDQTLILNENYTTELNNYKKGSVSYTLDSLADGLHTIKVKAWDTYNNSSEKKLDFIVAKSAKFAISQIINVPNPASEFTKFIINHNRVGENLALQLDIYNNQGQLVKKIVEDIQYANATLEIDWNIGQNDNYNITSGLYVYKCSIVAQKDGAVSDSIQRLVVVK